MVVYMNSIIDYKIIGSRIKKRRMELNLTQSQLSIKTNLTTFYISKLENSKAIPTLETLAILASALDTDLSYLVSGSSRLDKTYIDTRLENISKKASTDQMDLIIKIAEVILNE